MPLALRNLAIAQQRDKERFRQVEGGGYERPKALFVAGGFVMLKQAKDHTLQPSVRPLILRIVDLRGSGVVVAQGGDGATITHQVSQLAHCRVPISDHGAYPEKYKRTYAIHCQICRSRKHPALMLLCDVYDKGFHTFCLERSLREVPVESWRCTTHKVILKTK